MRSPAVLGRVPLTLPVLAVVVAMNAPFVLCHPGGPMLRLPVARSLGINLVLLVLPGLALVAAMVRRGWLARSSWVAVVLASSATLAVVVTAMHLAGRPPTATLAWNGTWLVTNAALVWCALPRAGSPFRVAWPWRSGAGHKESVVAVLLFAGAYLAYFRGATAVIPPMDDHDYEVQGTGYGLLADLKPMLLTDRHTTFYFAHPPLLHACVAGSFLYWGQLDCLKPYQEAWDRVRLAQQGELQNPPLDRFWRLDAEWCFREGERPEKATLHRIVGIDKAPGREMADYLIEPQLPDGSGRISVEDLEAKWLLDRYRHEPGCLPTRTPNVFFAALTVALVGAWVVRMTGRDWLGLLAAAAYASSPEVFVRSCYGGYFAIGQFAVLEMLLACEAEKGVRSLLCAAPGGPFRQKAPDPFFGSFCGSYFGCLLAGGFAALVDHKLLLLPAAVIIRELLRSKREAGSAASEPPATLPTLAPVASDRAKRLALFSPFFHPLVLGFALGTLLFWCYGLAISPSVFWLDHVRTHLVDRLAHHNPLGYTGYPSVGGLWLEFWRHTGYVLLPLGLISLAFAGWPGPEKGPEKGVRSLLCDAPGGPCRQKAPDPFFSLLCEAGTGRRLVGGPCRQKAPDPFFSLWLIWMLLVALSFSVIDWRQTKHLTPLLLPLFLAPARWAAKGRIGLLVVSVVFVGLLVWNLDMVRLLTANFTAVKVAQAATFAPFPVTPDW